MNDKDNNIVDFEFYQQISDMRKMDTPESMLTFLGMILESLTCLYELDKIKEIHCVKLLKILKDLSELHDEIEETTH